jgi:hypothetical protein
MLACSDSLGKYGSDDRCCDLGGCRLGVMHWRTGFEGIDKDMISVARVVKAVEKKLVLLF